MSDTYARLQGDIDNHWRYYRTKLWLFYMHVDTPVLPAPYNIIPSVPCIKYLWSKWKGDQSGRTIEDVEMTVARETDNVDVKSRDISYKELTRVLLCRYLLKRDIIKLPLKMTSDKKSDKSAQCPEEVNQPSKLEGEPNVNKSDEFSHF
ncbi:transient-receptor-potential-like protein [Glandiceps talaboti]